MIEKKPKYTTINLDISNVESKHSKVLKIMNSITKELQLKWALQREELIITAIDHVVCGDWDRKDVAERERYETYSNPAQEYFFFDDKKMIHFYFDYEVDDVEDVFKYKELWKEV